MKDIFVYCLLDPNAGDCRYVGVSNNPIRRFKTHMMNRQNNPVKWSWIRNLKTQNKLPILKILEKTNELHWETRERWWIRYFKKKNQKLTNLTNGGDGRFGIPCSENTKQKISNSLMAHTVSEESRQKMSMSAKKWIKENGHPMLGKKASPETLVKQSIARRGKKISSEHRNNIILSLQRRGDTRKDITFEKILQQAKLCNFNQLDICEYFRCGRHTLTHRVQKYGYKNWLDFVNKLNPGSNFKMIDKRPFPKNLTFEQILEQSKKCNFKLTNISVHFDCDRHFIVKVVRKNGYKDWLDFKKKISVEQAYLQKVG